MKKGDLLFSKANQKEIKSITFGLFSPSEIKKLSVCEITNTLSYDNDRKPSKDGIYDLRMGTIQDQFRCSTCKGNKINCPGHFGHINLARPVFHVGFIKEIIKILKCICLKCHRILIYGTKKYKQIEKISNPESRNSMIYNACKNIKKCKAKEGGKKSKPCNCIQPQYKVEGLKITIDFSNSEEKEKDKESKTEKDEESKRDYSPQEILEFFGQIPDDVFVFLGYNIEYAHPKWMIIQNLIVCPPSVRPSVSNDSGLISQDDLSHQYNQILKFNQELKKLPKENCVFIQDKLYNLQFTVATLMNNELPSSCGKATKKIGQNTQPIKAIFSRLKGKEGRIRGNLMGKRVDFSARSVISPDPNLEVDELGVPISIAMNVTFPEIVTNYNKEFLIKLIRNGPSKYPGARYIYRNDGSIINLKFGNKINRKLEEGYIVERYLLNGDYVIFNRQPSLHKMSMMGHRVHILNYKTFRLNLSVTTPYNADFDGDEMNLHVPQNSETRAEIKHIMSVEKQIISPQSNKPIMGIVQDSLIGCKIFTSRDTFLDYEQIMDLIQWINGLDISKLPMPCILKPKPLWSGKQIFSLLLSEKLNLTKLREDDPKGCEGKLNLIDNFVEIRKGELIQGIICKKTVGTSSGGIIHKIWIEINPEKAIEFLSNCQKMINNFLLFTGWTIGINDMICDEEINIKISNIKKNMNNTIKYYLNEAQNGRLESQPGKNMIDSFEYKANEELNNARNEAGKLIQKYLSSKNHLVNMVSAGSKGNPTNISQIMGFVGQQNLEGKRIPFNFKNRTLPHFVKDDYESKSKGFVEHSFIKGLKPHEFFFHAMGGREGVIDTSVKTSQSGYNSRKLVKCLEDIMINYDGTVRNSSGKIIQFLYGEDGFSGEYIENQKFETLNMDNLVLEKKYKFFEIDGFNAEILNNLLHNMQNCIEEAVINIIRNNLLQIKTVLEEEYKQIKEDRDYVRKNILSSNDNEINIPVNINSIIILAKNEYDINNYSKSDLDPLFVINKVKELKEELIQIKNNNKKGTEIHENSLTLFYMIINYTLSTKNVIIKHRLNKNALESVIKEIKHRFREAMVCPGEMVGSIAAQSIAEPATQMTLNTFHLAGVSSVNVTLGIPRLIEILNNSQNIKTPSMEIYLKEKKEKYSTKEIFEIIKKIEFNPLINVVSLFEIYYDPDIFHSILIEDKELIDDYISINGEEYSDTNISKWVLRIVFDKGYLFFKLSELEKKIIEYFNKENILIMHSREYEKNSKILIRLKSSDEMEPEKKENIKSLSHLKDFMEKLLTEIDCGGIKNIKKAYLRECLKIKYNENNGELITFKNPEDPLKEIIFETDGTNLQKVFEIDGVDYKRIISNDINEIYNVLGIEAARKVIIKEIRKVLKAYDIYINYRHFSILADFMTQRGKITPITRHGLDNSENSPIRKATFEESVKQFLNAGKFAEKDYLNGLSENILLGKLVKMGTGSFDLLFDQKFNNQEMKKLYGGCDDDNDDNDSDSYYVKSNYPGERDIYLLQSNQDDIKPNFSPYYYQTNNNQNISTSKNPESSPNPSPVYNPTTDYFKSPISASINNNISNSNPLRENNFYKSTSTPTIQDPINDNNNFPNYFPNYNSNTPFSENINKNKNPFFQNNNDDEEEEEEEEDETKNKEKDNE